MKNSGNKIILYKYKNLNFCLHYKYNMDEPLIKDYIASFQSREFGEIIDRELKVDVVKGKATTIIGPRRAGKTYYFFNLISTLKRDSVLYLEFEEPFLKDLSSKEVLKIVLKIFPSIVNKLPHYIFLDEIQNVKDWESLVRSLLNRGLVVYLTGSSSKLLSKEIATQLRGRNISYLLLPFSFREFLKTKEKEMNLNLLEAVGKTINYLEEYLSWGGFPEVVLTSNKEKILKEYVNLAFYKDFVERHEIKSISLASLLFNHILQNFSNEFSVKSIARKIKQKGVNFNINTLYQYMDYLEDTLFAFFLKKYSFKTHERETWPKKVYLCDTGLSKIVQFSQNMGKLMENTVFLELLRKTNDKPLMEIFYFKTNQGYEVDFLIKEGLRVKQLIQVTYANSFDEIEHREIRALLKAKEIFKEDNPELLIITWDYEDEKEVGWFGRSGRIKFVPLWKWLLNL